MKKVNRELISRLRPVSDEEKRILRDKSVLKDIYTTGREFTIDSKKMLDEGTLISIRPHTRFVAFPRHKHNYIEIIYMCSGKTSHIIGDGTEITLNAGDLLFLNQHCFHEILPAGEDDIAVNFVILPEFFDVAFDMLKEENVISNFIISSLKNEESDAAYLHFCVADVLPVQNLIENLVWSIMNRQENDVRINRLTMGLLFVQLLKYTDKLSGTGRENTRRMIAMKAVSYAEENYKSAELSFLANKVGMSVSALSKIIKNYTGLTFKELLRTKRLSRAAQFLTETSLSITDIITAVGYDNTSYFHRIFREKYGTTPLEYRKNKGNSLENKDVKK